MNQTNFSKWLHQIRFVPTIKPRLCYKFCSKSTSNCFSLLVFLKNQFNFLLVSLGYPRARSFMKLFNEILSLLIHSSNLKFPKFLWPWNWWLNFLALIHFHALFCHTSFCIFLPIFDFLFSILSLLKFSCLKFPQFFVPLKFLPKIFIFTFPPQLLLKISCNYFPPKLLLNICHNVFRLIIAENLSQMFSAWIIAENLSQIFLAWIIAENLSQIFSAWIISEKLSQIFFA